MAIVDVNHSQTIEEVLFKVGKGGSGGGRGLIVNATGDDETGIFTMDKTFGEIIESFATGNNVYIFAPQSERPPVQESMTSEELFTLAMAGGIAPFVVDAITGKVKRAADGMSVQFTIIVHLIVKADTIQTNSYYVTSDTISVSEDDPDGEEKFTRLVIENTWGKYPSTDQGENN